MRKVPFANEEYYHIYNRGVDKRKIFLEEKDYFRFLKGMKEFNRAEPIGSLMVKQKRDKQERQVLDTCSRRCPTPVVESLAEIIAYCLNPNHFHLILKQSVEKGISKFMHKLTMGYTNFFNIKNKRSGALFQGRFKSIHVSTNEYLLWLSGYVNGNDKIHSLEASGAYEFGSYPDYLGLRNGVLCNQEEMKIISNQFPNVEDYKEFVEMVIRESRSKKEMKKYLLEEL